VLRHLLKLTSNYWRLISAGSKFQHGSP
jgi:hypothetical protein